MNLYNRFKYMERERERERAMANLSRSFLWQLLLRLLESFLGLFHLAVTFSNKWLQVFKCLRATPTHWLTCIIHSVLYTYAMLVPTLISFSETTQPWRNVYHYVREIWPVNTKPSQPSFSRYCSIPQTHVCEHLAWSHSMKCKASWSFWPQAQHADDYIATPYHSSRGTHLVHWLKFMVNIKYEKITNSIKITAEKNKSGSQYVPTQPSVSR